MKRKFETNVAEEMPKTRAREPELPWRLKREDFEQIGLEEREYASSIGAPPLRTRAIFLILLVLAIFTAIFYMVINTMIENGNIRRGVLRKEQEVSSLRADLSKVTGEKKALSETSAQLEKKVGDLAAQKELFTSVIETLTKKGDEADVGPSTVQQTKDSTLSLSRGPAVKKDGKVF